MHSTLVNSNLSGQKLAPYIIKSVVGLYKYYNKYLIIYWVGDDSSSIFKL